ncbi:hypothetical protein RchiOBHm_Chr7g0187001 [Rosa chinensis]|uniref:Uncharacterized protein n=1 Tax=Rosa chinensis TaxID=74649 RepID=A0A2P6P458_ROSCH|nr:hypothetical protein RchiOBHm_Chr7g0187001 [Rosa chinensis]
MDFRIRLRYGYGLRKTTVRWCYRPENGLGAVNIFGHCSKSLR